jgi:porin
MHTPLTARSVCSTALALSLCLAAASAIAEEASKGGVPDPSIATSLPAKGDPDGTRAALAEKGVTYGLNYIGEVLGNPSGGLKQGAFYGGRLEGVFDADLEKLSNLKGLSFHTNLYQIHGAGLTRENINNYMPVSSIEALPSTRLFEFWLEQKVTDQISVRFGQQGIDSEFFTTDTGANFVNSTFGWAGIWADDFPSGGNGYPLAALGLRVKYQPSENLTFLAAVFNGDAAGPGPGDPQERNRYGLNFRLNDPPMFSQEIQYRYNREKGSSWLPGTIKLGACEQTGSVDDLRYDDAGVPTFISNRPARKLQGDPGVYAVLDQQIYRLPGDDAKKGVNAFLRVAGTPADRNPLYFDMDAGLVFSGLLPQRPDDNFGVAFAYSAISKNLYPPHAPFESLVEAYYKYQIVPGLVLQPDLQYIWHPGGGVTSDFTPIKDALVGGLRVTLNY